MNGLRSSPRAAAGCAALALVAAIWSVWNVHLLPLRLTPRSLEMATATASVVVDTRVSALLDPQQDAYSFESLTDRAVLLGSVMANTPVRDSIARRARVPVGVLRVEAPVTPQRPRAAVKPGSEKRTGDILKSTEQYRIAIEVNPSVPVLDVYAQAPSAARAEELANAAVDVSGDYLAGLAASEGTPLRAQLRLRPLGRAHGGTINEGVEWQVALLVFFVTLGVGLALLVVVLRVGHGWRLAALTERT